MIQAVLFDVIGTTVLEKDKTVISQCFDAAFKTHGLSPDAQFITANRGLDKKEMIARLVAHHQLPASLMHILFADFVKNVERQLHAFEAHPEASALFEILTSQGVKIGLGSGLPMELLSLLLTHLGWPQSRFDFIGTPGPNLRGRPHPDMIKLMMQQLAVDKPDTFLKVGDTAADVAEGKNAGVITAAVLSGTQSEDTLRAAGPDFLLQSLAEVRSIISSHQKIS